MFTGEYRHAIDDKGRIAVPARFRADFDGECVVARWLDGCLAMFPKQAWETLTAKVAALPFTDPNARLLQRQVFGGASPETVDKQGRILVPANLREYAGLESEALVLGSRDHAEIWAPQRWDTYSQALDDPSAFAAAIAGLGI